MLVIFDKLADAQTYVGEINIAMGYPIPGDPPTPLNPDGSPGVGWTVDWDIPYKSYSANLWSVAEAPVSSGVPFPVTAVNIMESLTADWYPPPDGAYA